MADDSQESLFQDAGLCQYLLDHVTPSADLEIGQSLITGAGSALFTKTDIAEGEEVFQSQPLISVVLDQAQNVCEYCFRDGDSRVHPSGRFRSRHDALEVLPVCEQCGVSRFCSEVSVTVPHCEQTKKLITHFQKCKDCVKKSIKGAHQHECKLFSKEPMSSAKHRALCRILLQKKHGQISDQMWQALHKLESHYEKRVAKPQARTINDVTMRAKIITNSEEDGDCISKIFCIVSQPNIISSGLSSCQTRVLLWSFWWL